jgi:SlyX protein
MEPPNDTEQRLTALEIKASFAEDLVDELNQVIVRQQAQLDALTQAVLRLQAQAPAADGAPFRSLRDELPPHY